MTKSVLALFKTGTTNCLDGLIVQKGVLEVIASDNLIAFLSKGSQIINQKEDGSIEGTTARYLLPKLVGVKTLKSKRDEILANGAIKPTINEASTVEVSLERMTTDTKAEDIVSYGQLGVPEFSSIFASNMGKVVVGERNSNYLQAAVFGAKGAGAGHYETFTALDLASDDVTKLNPIFQKFQQAHVKLRKGDKKFNIDLIPASEIVGIVTPEFKNMIRNKFASYIAANPQVLVSESVTDMIFGSTLIETSLLPDGVHYLWMKKGIVVAPFSPDVQAFMDKVPSTVTFFTSGIDYMIGYKSLYDAYIYAGGTLADLSGITITKVYGKDTVAIDGSAEIVTTK